MRFVKALVSTERKNGITFDKIYAIYDTRDGEYILENPDGSRWFEAKKEEVKLLPVSKIKFQGWSGTVTESLIRLGCQVITREQIEGALETPVGKYVFFGEYIFWVDEDKFVGIEIITRKRLTSILDRMKKLEGK